MPIPKPNTGESKEDFISRCMGDNVMNKEYPDESQRAAVCNAQWDKKEYSEFIENQTYDVKDVEIFSAGKWNGDEYTEQDLDDIVTAYWALKTELKPYLKLGHNEKQELLQKDGMPAAGWVVNLKRSGKKLLADFMSVPKKIKELIDKKAFGRFSSEIYWNLKSGEKTFRRALKAVALLGADTPAVQTLDDFINLYTDNKIECEIIKTYYEDINMDEKAIESLQTQLKEYAEKEVKHNQEVVQFKQSIIDLEGQVKTLTEQIETKNKEKLEIEVKSYIDSKLKEGKILPSQVKQYTELAIKNFEEVKAIVDNMPKIVEFKEESEHLEKPEKEKTYSEMNEDEKDEFKDNEAKKYMKENKVTYKEALLKVSEKLEG